MSRSDEQLVHRTWRQITYSHTAVHCGYPWVTCKFLLNLAKASPCAWKDTFNNCSPRHGHVIAVVDERELVLVHRLLFPAVQRKAADENFV